MKIRVPTELPIMGKRVKIEYVYGLEEDGETLSGLCRSRENLIKICLKENTTEESVHLTLAHEAFHYVVHKSGLSHLLGENEESLTVCTEENFVPLFRFNKRIWRKVIEVELGC